MSILLPGWACPSCLAFNGDAKENLAACRACSHPRPSGLEESFATLQATCQALIRITTDVQEKCTALVMMNRELQKENAGLQDLIEALQETARSQDLGGT